MSEAVTDRVRRYDLVTPMIPCRDEIVAGFARILMSGQYILGEEVQALEREMAAACSTVDAVGVDSGSSALHVALEVAGVGPGTEVITTPYTFLATVEAIVRLGGTPVFVDILPHDLNFDPALVEAAITPRTRVILPVHIFGTPCDMDPLLAIAARHGLDLIEDMAQAFGSFYRGRPCGSFGRMACLSFYPTKNLPAMGDAGLVLCRDAADAATLRQLRGHEAVLLEGRLHSGWNYRIDEVQSMVIRVRLARFLDEQRDRDRVADIYNGLIPAANRLAAPDTARGDRVTHHQYWVRSRRRDELRQLLAREGIDTGVYYHPPIHRHPLGRQCREAGPLVEAERAGAEVLTLPIHPALPEAAARRIGGLVRDFLGAEATAAPAPLGGRP
ncbi:MAG: DegT/DnrJ/EryC1/StrS family aminotransferase [Candidatus Krumholzibacteriia bacterium]